MSSTLDFEFDHELFNDLYFHLEKDFSDEEIRFIFCYGGSSASKTYTVVQLVIIRMLMMSENTMILRKYGVDIKDSIYSDFTSIISDWGLSEYFKCQINYIECLVTGSYIRFRGLDDSEKIKGLAGFKRVILEEISQFEEVDLKQIRKRLRGKRGQQIIGLFNPIDESHWLKANLFDKLDLIEQTLTTDITSCHISKEGNFKIYKVTYLNNKYIVGPHFVDQHTIDDFEKDKVDDFNYYQIYGLGNWGKIRVGGEFWKDFNSNMNVTHAKWNEDLPIHQVWDENVNPYLTCLVFQVEIINLIKHVRQIDEICLPDPRNRRRHVAAEFKSRYPVEKVKGLFIYGDRTSWKEDTGKEKGENFFTDILSHLKEYKPILRLQSVNPSIVQSGGFVNQLWAGRIEGISLEVSKKCTKSIYDYQYALEDSDGTLKKTKKTHPVTKVSYEEFGHPSDCIRYLCTVALADEYNQYLRGGKKVAIKSVTFVRKHQY